ncbi:Hypothetical predicted protein [Cloeon dipterum]|uniref:Uncharacterized protein n=1 Tax=Cloeon dipterum TaxID=197152 RepID=A0A8S1DBY5_9INSE|nr:Hypothetical predicted protein [Cloeon dipterum]
MGSRQLSSQWIWRRVGALAAAEPPLGAALSPPQQRRTHCLCISGCWDVDERGSTVCSSRAKEPPRVGPKPT